MTMQGNVMSVVNNGNFQGAYATSVKAYFTEVEDGVSALGEGLKDTVGNWAGDGLNNIGAGIASGWDSMTSGFNWGW